MADLMAESFDYTPPGIYTYEIPVKDDLITATSEAQDETAGICFANSRPDDFLRNQAQVKRSFHAEFLRKNLGKLPAPFIAADASRPWFFYWCFNGLYTLGEDVSAYRERLMDTAKSMQNITGGFGGGSGQDSHLATTYALVLALIIVGGEECYNVIDRRSLWRWLCSLKQPSGGFRMCVGGEEDIRGAYCAAVIISLLNLPLSIPRDSPAWKSEDFNLLTGLGDHVRGCQTFEGGISAQPGAEAHGAYAFCALGCLSILGAPSQTFNQYLDVSRLISWLSSRQNAPEGGFSGRTNKLIDGCYSHWVGACWPLIEACLSTPASSSDIGAASNLPSPSQSLFSKEGLIHYILCCCQDNSKRGGLRDKPGKPSDAYHSCYVLSGLSSAQHIVKLSPYGEQTSSSDLGPQWTTSPYPAVESNFHEDDRMKTLHPVFVIPNLQFKLVKEYFATKQGF